MLRQETEGLRAASATQEYLSQKPNRPRWRRVFISKCKHEVLSSLPNTSLKSTEQQRVRCIPCARKAACGGSWELLLASQSSQSVSSRFNTRPYLKKESGEFINKDS